jgi:vacuolar-type H+-ATPase subunit H
MRYNPRMNIFNKVVVVISATVVMAGALTTFAQDAAALTCVQAAIDVRDNAIIAAWDVQYPAVKTALQTRQAALKSAWMQTDQKIRREATRTAWNIYKESVKSARATMKAKHKTAWTAFESARKACSPKATKDDNGSLGMDSQL